MSFERTKASVNENEGTDDIQDETPIVTTVTPNETPKEDIVEGDDPVVVEALRNEIRRLRKQRKLDTELPKVEAPTTEIQPVAQPTESLSEISRSEQLIYNAWQAEALDDFLESHSEYEDEDAWNKFMLEWKDRSPITEYAKNHNLPVSKKLFKKRMDSIHLALGGGVSEAAREATDSALKAHAIARIAQTGSSNIGSQGSGSKSEKTGRTTERILPKTTVGFSSWVK